MSRRAPGALSALTAAALAGALILCSGASAERAQPRVVGGHDASVADAPWTAVIVAAGAADLFDSQRCGGTILDATHLATAAQCVTGADGAVIAPSTIEAVAGLSDLDTPAGSQRSAVQAIDRAPGYDATTFVDDVALLTLATPLDLSGAQAAPVALPVGSGPTEGSARVSGWGDLVQHQTSADGIASSFPSSLQIADLPLVADAACQQQLAAVVGPIDATAQLCAGAPGLDACQRDLGGPLVTGVGSLPVLAGLVSFGEGCGSDAPYPGVYARAGAVSVRALLALAPGRLRRPELSGRPRPGERVRCSPGQFTGAPERIAVSVLTTDAAGADRRIASDSAAYTVAAADLGRRVVCRAEASNAKGAIADESVPSEPVSADADANAATALTAAGTVLPGSAAADRRAPRLVVVASGRVDRRGRVRVRLRADETARVAIALRSRGKVRRRYLQLARRTSTLVTGTARTFTLKLSASGRRRVTGSRRLGGLLVVRTSDSSGNASSTVVKLRLRRAS